MNLSVKVYTVAEFIYKYRNSAFVKHIVLVSSVAENLGKGVVGEGEKDLFICTIREKVKESLLKKKNMNPEISKEIADGIVRSKISFEREYFAFTPQ